LVFHSGLFMVFSYWYRLAAAGLFLCLKPKSKGKPKTHSSAKDKRRIMPYSSGFLSYIIQVLNRKAAQSSKFGLDGDGIEWEEGDCLHCNISNAKGVSAMNAGALDAYKIKQVRMRWTNRINMRSRVRWNDQVYQIIPETFHDDFHADTLQFNMQLIINDK